MINAQEALQRLKEGNERFVKGIREKAVEPERRAELIGGQAPFAIILGCSDSRVPAELVFDQGLGDLFVIRIAGNIVAPSQVGSVEFAAEQFGSPLVVVLGHSNCGAVAATVAEMSQPSETRSPNLASIVERIRPAVEPLLDSEVSNDPQQLLAKATRANVRISAAHLRSGSKILEQLIAEGRLSIVGAEYSLESGEVSFFDGVEER